MTAKADHDIYYFIKLLIKTADCQEVYEMEHIRNGKEYLWLWIRLGMMSANRDGVLSKTIANRTMPLTVYDIANELRGAYSEPEIREGLMLLEQMNFIGRITDPSSGYEYFVVSPLASEQGVFHMLGSSNTFRPMIVGTDSAYAEYQRNRRAEIRRREQPLQIGLKKTSKTVKDIMKAASCSKQTVFNRIANEHLESFTSKEGRMTVIEPDAAAYLVAVIKGKKPDPQFVQILESVRSVHEIDEALDDMDNGLDEGLDDDRPVLDVHSSISDAELRVITRNPALHSHESSDETRSLKKIHRSKENDEDVYTCSEAELKELCLLAVEKEPSVHELRTAEQMVRLYGKDAVRDALKCSGHRRPSDPMAYAYAILKNTGTSAVEDTRIDGTRSIDSLLAAAGCEFGCSPEELPEWFVETADRSKKYYSDRELLYGLRNMSIREDYSSRSFRRGLREESGI